MHSNKLINSVNFGSFAFARQNNAVDVSRAIWEIFRHLALIREENTSKLDSIWAGFVYPSHLELEPKLSVLTNS